MNENIRKAMIAASETRERLQVLAGKPEPTAEEKTETTELRTKATSLEGDLRTALADTGDGGHLDDEGGVVEDAEDRERREIRSKAKLVNFVQAAIDRTALTGAEAEASQAFGCAGGRMPIQMLFTETRDRETRDITPGVTAPGAGAPIAGSIFQRTAAASIGAVFPAVESGSASYPVMTSVPSAAALAKDATAPATAGAFRLDTRTPIRISGQFEVRVEDLALLPGMEESLRMAINDVLGDTLDVQFFTGNGVAPNLSGIFHQAADVSAESDIETFATGVARFAALVDGQYSNGMQDLRAVLGVDTYAKYACTAPGFLDTRLRYAAWRSSYCWRASSGVRYASFSRRQHWL